MSFNVHTDRELLATACQQTLNAPKGTNDYGLTQAMIDNHWRVFGALPSKPEVRSLIGAPKGTPGRIVTASEYFDEAGIEIITEDQWATYGEVNNSEHVQHILDQDGVGSCATEDTAQMIMGTASLQGQPVVLLNPWTLYRQVTNVDNGSDTLEDVQVAQKVGILPMSYWDRAIHGWRSTPPQGWEAIAAEFRVDDYIVFEKELELQTWLRLRRFAGLSNASFWGGGHSTTACIAYPNGDVGGPNSWGLGYGTKGYYRMPRRHVQRGFAEGFSQVGVFSVKVSYWKAA